MGGVIENKGLANVTVTNNGATVDNNGKIGKCYSFGGGKYIFSKNVSDLKSKFVKEISLCAWVYPTSTNSDDAIISLTNGSTGWNDTFAVLSTHGGNIVYFSVSGESSRSCKYVLPLNIWSHVIGTYDGERMILYVNGSPVSTVSRTTIPIFSSITTLSIGSWVGTSSYSFNGKLNDVRIYDHCLSPAEVKEISKGLVLHYPLNDAYIEPTTNIDTDKTSSPSFGGMTLCEKTNYMGKECYHIKCTGSGSGWFGCYRSRVLTTVGNTYTLSCDLLVPSGQNESYWHGVPYAFENCNVLKVKNYREYGTYDEWHHCYCTATVTGSNSNFLYYWIAGTNGTGNIEFYITNMQLEEKNHATPYTPSSRNETTVYDCSGYGNNGTVTSTSAPTISNDSPRYDKSYYFVDNSKYIYSNIYMPGGNQITMSYWFKSNTTGFSSYHIPLCINSSNYEASINPSGGLRGGFVINGSRIIEDNGSVLLNNQWHMCTVTYDGSTIKRYIDGVLVGSTSSSGTLSSGNMELTIGRYGSSNTTYGNKQAYMSDVRLYSTALSQEDIQELYNTSAKISKNGTLFCYELKED